MDECMPVEFFLKNQIFSLLKVVSHYCLDINIFYLKMCKIKKLIYIIIVEIGMVMWIHLLPYYLKVNITFTVYCKTHALEL